MNPNLWSLQVHVIACICRFMCEGGQEVARGGDGARLLVELGDNCDDGHHLDNDEQVDIMSHPDGEGSLDADSAYQRPSPKS